MYVRQLREFILKRCEYMKWSKSGTFCRASNQSLNRWGWSCAKRQTLCSKSNPEPLCPRVCQYVTSLFILFRLVVLGSGPFCEGAGLGSSAGRGWMRHEGNSLRPLPLLHCCRKRKKAQQVRIEFPVEWTDGSACIRRHVEVLLYFDWVSNRVAHANLSLLHLQVRKMSLFFALHR